MSSNRRNFVGNLFGVWCLGEGGVRKRMDGHGSLQNGSFSFAKSLGNRLGNTGLFTDMQNGDVFTFSVVDITCLLGLVWRNRRLCVGTFLVVLFRLVVFAPLLRFLAFGWVLGFAFGGVWGVVLAFLILVAIILLSSFFRSLFRWCIFVSTAVFVVTGFVASTSSPTSAASTSSFATLVLIASFTIVVNGKILHGILD